MLLVHQGMIEYVFLDDMKSRGVEVKRECLFETYSIDPVTAYIRTEYKNVKHGTNEVLSSKFLVGCDGAHSRVRKAMLPSEPAREPGRSIWGVLDGKIMNSSPSLLKILIQWLRRPRDRLPRYLEQNYLQLRDRRDNSLHPKRTKYDKTIYRTASEH